MNKLRQLWYNYGLLGLLVLMLGCTMKFDGILLRPLALLTDFERDSISRVLLGSFIIALGLLAARYIRLELLHGLLERHTGRIIPPLLGNLASFFIVLITILYVLSAVFGQNISTVLATGGLGLAILGVALRDIILAVFTGAILSVERPFKVGDRIMVNDNLEGDVVAVNWRSTTIMTPLKLQVSIPNIQLANAAITNFEIPDSRSERRLTLWIDYNTSVESAERILLAAVLGTEGISLVAPPAVYARAMERDGVRYEVRFVIMNHREREVAEHAVIRSILSRMRDAGITISYPKLEQVRMPERVRISDRSLDRFHLISQCGLFRSISEQVQHAIAGVLIEQHYRPNDVIVRTGEVRPSVFVIGEGLVVRSQLGTDTQTFTQQKYVATEYFGRGSLFAGMPHYATAVAQTDALVYELTHEALAPLLHEDPSMVSQFAHALAHLRAQQSKPPLALSDPAVERWYALYIGQIEAAYSLPANNAR